VAHGIKTGGRQKGTPNKTTALLKDAILIAADRAGDREGLVGYLTFQAKTNPAPFMTLLGKVLPTQIGGDPNNPLEITASPTDTERVRGLAALLARTNYLIVKK
jgi:hypothetical protein